MAINRGAGVSDGEAGLRTRILYWFVKRKLGKIPHGVRVRARDPKLLELSGRMDMHIAKPESVPAVLTELAQIKVAVMVGCPF